MRTPQTADRLRLRDRPVGRTPLMHHRWRDLLFLHWRIDPERIRRTLPPGLSVDTFDGAAYVGLVPFFMCDIRPHGLPAVPGLSNFLGLNVRTYVYDEQGTPGVWFYSLDCNSRTTVFGARTFFHLPYRTARMQAERRGATIEYRSLVRGNSRACAATYAIGPAEGVAAPGSLEFFLVERYVLFAADRRGRLFTGRVHHAPYPTAATDVSHLSGDLLEEHDFGVRTTDAPAHVCGSPGVDVDVYALEAA